MKHYTLILATLLSLLIPVQSWGDDWVKGRFECKVQYQKILEMKEGLPTEYESYNTGVKVGDTFQLNYEYFTPLNKLKFATNYEDIIRSEGFAMKDPAWGRKFEEQITKTKITMDEEGDFLDIQESDSSLVISRYYKNDWSGVYLASQRHLIVHMMGLNCRHTDDKFEKIFSHLESTEGNWFKQQ